MEETTMDTILKELFGDDEPQAPPAASTQPAAEAEPGKRTEAEREARREKRRQRKADQEHQRKRNEFVERYEAGNPSEGFTTDEALGYLREMREEMSPEDFREALRRTLEHLPADQRDEFIAMMRQHKAAPPAAAAAAGLPRQDPFGGLLTGLMGGGAAAGSGGLGALFDDLSKGGVRAPSQPGSSPTEADFEALMNSPLARAVLGGVAAYGLQNMQADDDDRDTPGGTRARG
jgi:hypothetical protein